MQKIFLIISVLFTVNTCLAVGRILTSDQRVSLYLTEKNISHIFITSENQVQQDDVMIVIREVSKNGEYWSEDLVEITGEVPFYPRIFQKVMLAKYDSHGFNLVEEFVGSPFRILILYTKDLKYMEQKRRNNLPKKELDLAIEAISKGLL